MPRNLGFQSRAFTGVPVERAPQPGPQQAHGARRDRGAGHPQAQPQDDARVLYTVPQRSDVFVEMTRDGADYFLICPRHQWASPAVSFLVDVGVCPFCIGEIDAHPGRRRYAALQAVSIRTR